MTFNSGSLRGISVLCVPSFLKSLDRVDIVARKLVVRIKCWVILYSFFTNVMGRPFWVMIVSICVRKCPPICGYSSGCSGISLNETLSRPASFAFYRNREKNLVRQKGLAFYAR